MDVDYAKVGRVLGSLFKWACRLSMAGSPVIAVTDESKRRARPAQLKVVRVTDRQSVVLAVNETAIGMSGEKALELSDELTRAAVDIEPGILARLGRTHPPRLVS